MEGLQPTFDVNGNNNNGWGNGWGALIGGAVGGAFGAGWNRNNYNGGNCAVNAGNQFIMDTLTTMRTDIDSIGRDQLMQTANLNGTMAQGFGAVNATTQGIAAQLAQGQSRTEAAVLTTGLQGQIQQKDNVIAQLAATHANEVQSLHNTFDIVSSQKDCCCNTQKLIQSCCCETNQNITQQGCDTRSAIHAEGEATRALMNQLDRDRLLRESAAKDARIAQLEAQQFNTGLTQGAMQQNRTDMQTMLNTILTAITASRTTTSTTTA